MGNSYTVGMQDTRPWGRWEVIGTSANYAIKLIEVNPGQSLSVQYHHRRSESWTVAIGLATVYLDGQRHELVRGQSIEIPVEAIHKIENNTDEPLHIIEVQLGDQLAEDDIVRLEDRYGRVETPLGGTQ
jgi:mannose-6-phosphate isomerase-like protein (cupin superfamily)